MKIGDIYDRLTIIGESVRTRIISKNGKKYTSTKVLVRCVCGNEKSVSVKGLTRGDTRSCGCLHIEGLQNRKKHGRTKTREYRIWTLIKNRCFNRNCKDYEFYGGKGIKMDETWERSFEDFLIDMGEAPSKDHSIDRIRNEGDYEPLNCRWATSLVQQNNKSNNIQLTVDGITLPLGIWAATSGIKRTTIWSRIRYYGWSPKDAVTIPASYSNKMPKITI